VARARPYERYCDEDGNGFGCNNADRFASFYSLHSAVAFTSAGFSCAMHLSRSLYGDEVADGASCATSLVAAGAVAALRIAADRHYLTDVLLGSAMGLVVGYVVPLLLVPQRRPPGSPPVDRGANVMVMPMFSPGLDGSMSTSTIGLSAAGVF
jgi:membrane-associated phospholipid phosphatase